jgi:hypothetical protein
MKPVTRRSVMAGSAAVVAAVPAAGLCIGLTNDAALRVEHHTRELERAMRELYGREVEMLRFEPTDGMAASVVVVANVGGTARPRANSKWLYVGQE